MDSRDIKEEPIEIKDGSYLEQMYSYQKEILDKYIGIEGLPSYPFNINVKNNQIILKDFVGRVIEELAECEESMRLVEHYTQKNKLWMDLTVGVGDEKVLEDLIICSSYLQNVGEELVDALHFMLELLIYSNIQPEDINSYIRENLEKAVFPSIESLGVLQKSMIVGHTILFNMGMMQYDSKAKVNLIQVHNDNLITQDPRYLEACHMYNPMSYFNFKAMFWEVTYHLNIARNYLKNKPWKQTQMLSDEVRFQGEIVTAFVVMMGMVAEMGVGPSTLYWLYFKKNRVNLFRINSKY